MAAAAEAAGFDGPIPPGGPEGDFGPGGPQGPGGPGGDFGPGGPEVLEDLEDFGPGGPGRILVPGRFGQVAQEILVQEDPGPGGFWRTGWSRWSLHLVGLDLLEIQVRIFL